MDYGLRVGSTDGSQTGFSSIHFEKYIDQSQETHIPITCSQQHLTFENSIKVGQKYIIGENFQRNELAQYNNVCSQGAFIDPRDTGNFTKLKRSSLRGRRRYRRTLLRNYEQPFCTNVSTNGCIELNEETDVNPQRRVFLRNTTINGGGSNHPSVRYNSNPEQYTKISKPSWDGGRLVKLLQGHGLNIENYEKETESISNVNWNSKLLSFSEKNMDTSHIYENTNNIYTANEEIVNLSKVNNCVDGNNASISEYGKSDKVLNYSNVNSTNCAYNETIYSRSVVLTDEIIKLNQLNCVENTITDQKHYYFGDHLVKSNYENKNVAKDQQISNVEFMQNEDKMSQFIQDKKKFVGFPQQSFFEETSNDSTTKMENKKTNQNNEMGFNIEIQHSFDTNENGVEPAIRHILSPPKFPFDTSHEELFVTLGDTPTSKTNYNISSLFVPNQDT